MQRKRDTIRNALIYPAELRRTAIANVNLLAHPALLGAMSFRRS